jgi:hypothetical protein
MQRDLHDQISAEARDLALRVGDNVWRMHVYGVTCIGRELFIQTMLVGPRTCSVVVRVAAGAHPRQIAREALRLIRAFLASGHETEHAVLESADLPVIAC